MLKVLYNHRKKKCNHKNGKYWPVIQMLKISIHSVDCLCNFKRKSDEEWDFITPKGFFFFL